MAPRRERAIVLGASLAGLLTARVLAEFFDAVTLVDRDRLPDGPVPRAGVPQGRQVHGLHARGREVLEQFFPGLTDELVASGATVEDVQQDVRWVNDGHRLCKGTSGMRGIGVARPLLEQRVRARVRALPGISFSDPVDVLGPTSAGDRVTGVRLRARGAGRDDEEAVDADLVVDATGRGSHTPAWLEELGFPEPVESSITIGVSYTTWDVSRRPEDLGGDLAAVVGPTVANSRFGAVLAVDGPRWQVLAGGYLGDAASARDFAAFRRFIGTLSVPDIGELIADREPLGPGRL
ncbi:MAG: FAD-dependent oxidoreductase, partial [Actinomycetes bacterium]